MGPPLSFRNVDDGYVASSYVLVMEGHGHEMGGNLLLGWWLAGVVPWVYYRLLMDEMP